MQEKILEIFSYTLPAIITGAVAYYFFLEHSKTITNLQRFEIVKENQKHALPLRFQAYERMSLFLERINPSKLLLRVAPIGDSKTAYIALLRNAVEQEFEHNLTQQIYISDKCWNVIIASKNATTHIMNKVAAEPSIETAQDLREAILKRMVESEPPSNTALAFIKDEVSSLY